MAQQIIIDIVADTKKLTSGIDDTNKQLGGMSKSLKTAASAAAGLASAFVLKKGISFLKDGIEEAKDAAAAMRAATATFGQGSKALEQITKDAEKFGKELAIDNDELIKLGTQLGSRLPDDVKASSVQLVKIFKDVEAFTGGAVSAEAAGNKLAKAFADGKLKATELQKVFPNLSQSVYDQAEALSKAGKNTEALNLLTDAAAKKYGDAASKNVDATQKFNVALDNFKETLGTKVLPILEKGIDFLTKILDAFDALPGPVQNVVLAFGAIVAIGGPMLTFAASMSTAMTTLGITSTAGSVGLNLVRVALAGLGIGLVIAAIVLLVENWDTVVDVVKKVWEKIKDFGEWFYPFIKDTFEKVWDKVKEVWDLIWNKTKEIVSNIIDWVKNNWPLLLGILTGPFGLFAAYLIKHKDEILETLKTGWEAIKTKVVEIAEGLVKGVSSWFNALKDYFAGLFKKGADTIYSVLENGWNAIKENTLAIFEILVTALQIVWLKIGTVIVDNVSSIVTGSVNKFNELKDKAILAFKKLQTAASEIWGLIKDYIGNAVDNIKNKFSEVYGKMIEVGKDIARGIADGLTSMTGWFRTLLASWINNNIPGWVKKVLQISSPSKVMMNIGEQITQGLFSGMQTTTNQGITLPTINLGTGAASTQAPIVVNITAGLGTDPYTLGQVVSDALRKYGTVSRNAVIN